MQLLFLLILILIFVKIAQNAPYLKKKKKKGKNLSLQPILSWPGVGPEGRWVSLWYFLIFTMFLFLIKMGYFKK
jgi:hypothetical protein